MLMPSVFKQDRKSMFILAALLLIVAFAQAENMFGFPYYHDEEGTHIANGWSVATQGRLSPYTYSYEDPFGGPIIMAAWDLIIGGPAAYGFPLNSGRILMLIMHVAATALIYLNAKKITRSEIASLVASLIFALSPLTTAMQRVVHMENIMVVWLLAALYLVVGENRTLMHYYASAFMLGLAFLTEESAIFFIPMFLYIVYSAADKQHRRFAVTLWLAIVVLVVSFYPMYAQMKEELFP